MPEKKGLYQNGVKIELLNLPSKDGPFYLQLYTLCGGVWVKEKDEPVSQMRRLPANQKNLFYNRQKNTDAFYMKSNFEWPPRLKCVGVQLVMVKVNVDRRELNEAEQTTFNATCADGMGTLPRFYGFRIQAVQDVRTSSKDGASELGGDKKKTPALTPLTAPLYLYRKTGEIVNSYRGPNGKFDPKDLKERGKDSFVRYLSFLSQNLETFQPLEMTKQTLQFFLKTIQDFLNKRE